MSPIIHELNYNKQTKNMYVYTSTSAVSTLYIKKSDVIGDNLPAPTIRITIEMVKQ